MYYKVEHDKIVKDLDGITSALGSKLLAVLQKEYNAVANGVKLLLTKKERDDVTRSELETQLDRHIHAIGQSPISDFSAIQTELNAKVSSAHK